MFSSVFEPAVVKTILKNRFSTQDAKAKFESEWNQNVSAQTLQKKLVLITTAGQATLKGCVGIFRSTQGGEGGGV